MKRLPVAERLAQAGKRAAQAHVLAEVEELKERLAAALIETKYLQKQANKKAYQQHHAVYHMLGELVEYCRAHDLYDEPVARAEAFIIENEIAPIEEPK